MSEDSSNISQNNNNSDFLLSESVENSKSESLKHSSKVFKLGRWTKEEHDLLIDEVLSNGIRNWKKVIIL